jgi:acyl-CoA synthetase (AMP-forming)/AMP-acid ligase II
VTVDAQFGAITEPFTGRRWEPAQIRAETAMRARSYATQGLEPGDRVLLLYGNRIEVFADILALWSLGCCVIPVDPGLTPFEIGKVAESAGTRFCIVPEQGRAGNPSAIADPVMLRLRPDETNQPQVVAAGIFPRLDDDALIIFTSGSTGRPKGVVHTHRSIAARFTTLRQLHGTADFARTLCIMPTHAIPLVSNFLFPWLSGCDIFVTPPYDAMVLMKLGRLVDEHGITFFVSVPSMWSLVLKAAAPPARGTLRRIHNVSASLPKDTWEAMQGWSGTRRVVTAYGTTESASWAAGVLEPDVIPEEGLIGVGWGYEVKVTRMRGQGTDAATDEPCPAGESGMIWLHGPGLMRGFLDRQDLTDAIMRRGWYMTGDLGFIDDRGRLFVHGRARDEINRGGVKVFPADIDHVATQFSGTLDACAFRVPDELYGETVGIAVVLKDRNPGTLAGLHGWLEQRLARHKMPARWYLVDSLPRAHRGKINRDEVMRQCEPLPPIDMAAALREPGRG